MCTTFTTCVPLIRSIDPDSGSMTMNITKLRNRKAISPVISTIVLIVVALVIALLVGVFAFGLFTSQTKSVSLQSGNLYASDGHFNYVLKNPGSAGVLVNSVTLTGATPDTLSGTGCLGTAAAGTSTLFTCTGSSALTSGNTYDYVINLANGQSISGSVVSQ